MATANEEILVAEMKFARTLTLNRPQKLNALTPQMLSSLTQHLASYEVDPRVKVVILKGYGKAFCAGADISQMLREGVHWRLAAKYFWDEFRLDYLIATYSKPQVSILDGIVMGAGVGISVKGKFRIATEETLFSMPETLIGVSPTAGGSFFFSRLPRFFGVYLGLTGARVDGAEMLACGLATHFVPSNKLRRLEEALVQVNTSDPSVISQIIDEYSLQRPPLKKNSACKRLDIIEKCFSKGSVEEILHACIVENKGLNDEWLLTAIQSMKLKASPIALKVTLRQLTEGRHASIGECLVREYRIMCHASRGECSRDYLEGCRATLVDKDQKPKWEPSRLDLITDEMVAHYFTQLDDDEWNDLDLHVRSTLPATDIMSKL